MSDTIIDLMAAKLTGLRLAKKYNSDVLYVAHMRHPNIKALEEGFIAAFCNEYGKPTRVKVADVEAAVADARKGGRS